MVQYNIAPRLNTLYIVAIIFVSFNDQGSLTERKFCYLHNLLLMI